MFRRAAVLLFLSVVFLFPGETCVVHNLFQTSWHFQVFPQRCQCLRKSPLLFSLWSGCQFSVGRFCRKKPRQYTDREANSVSSMEMCTESWKSCSAKIVGWSSSSETFNAYTVYTQILTEWRYSRQTNCIALRLSFFGVVLVAQSVFRQSWRWQTADTRWSANKTRWLSWRLELTLLQVTMLFYQHYVLKLACSPVRENCCLFPTYAVCSSSGTYRFSKYFLQAEVNKELAEPT